MRYFTFLLALLPLWVAAQEGQESGTNHPKAWTLAACIEHAMKENIQVQKSHIALENSKVNTWESKGELFPSLSFSTAHNYENRAFADKAITDKNSYTGSYGLNASWTVWNGGRRQKTIEQQKLQEHISSLSVVETKNNIEEAITQAYLQILYAEESVKTNESIVELTRAQVERSQELLTVGSISRSDLAQLEAQLSNDKYLLVNAQTALRNYKLQLKQLLELEGDEEMEIINPQIDNSRVLTLLPDKMEAYEAALAHRPEIESGKLNIEAAEMNIAIAKSAYMPSISLTAGLGTSHSSGTDFTFSEQIKNRWNESVGITLSVPIFNNRKTKSSVQKAKLAYETSKLDLANEQKSLFSTIESLWLDATTAQERFIAAQERVNSSQISYDLVDEQFSLGLKNTVELLTEKNNLLSARQELLQAKYMAIMNIQLLRFYCGEEIQI